MPIQVTNRRIQKAPLSSGAVEAITMPATFYTTDATFDSQPEAPSFQLDEMEPTVRDLVDLEMEDEETVNIPKSTNRRTNDLVRLYLQDIGRVRLLGRDEEVSEAQQVQRYMRLLELRDQAAQEEDGVLRQYVELIEIHDRLAANLGHRPSFERWANAAQITVSEDRKSVV